MITFMLDTNICIYIIKKKPEQVLGRLKNARISDIGVSSITLSELAHGTEKSSRPDQNKIALAEFLAPLEILSYDDMAAQEYGQIRAYLERHGTPIGPMDMLIAAHALSLNSTLVTNNEREFSRVASLKIENWAQ
ncbi:MAG: type II toxin-antitoxin system VapC family toxin [Thermodesulfobacteriota bacterium]|nr:type II toxin-antitoxin system VapC family toxin [Thermodesulfobacteriota bacterium]